MKITMKNIENRWNIGDTITLMVAHEIYKGKVVGVDVKASTAFETVYIIG